MYKAFKSAASIAVIVPLLSPLLGQTKMKHLKNSPYINEFGVIKNAKAPTKNQISRNELRKRISSQNKKLFLNEYKHTKKTTNKKIFNSIYDTSDILSVGQFHTILPAGSVIYVPGYLKNEVFLEKINQTSFLPLSDFLKRFAGLIEPVEINHELINGKAFFSEETTKNEASKQKVLVAFHQGNPVSCAAKFNPSKLKQ